jgi:hypothetical protein
MVISWVPIKCETKKKRNETKRNQRKRNETKSTKTKRNQRNGNEMKRNQRNRLIWRKWKERNKRQNGMGNIFKNIP